LWPASRSVITIAEKMLSARMVSPFPKRNFPFYTPFNGALSSH
jgi:hypothetical protein